MLTYPEIKNLWMYGSTNNLAILGIAILIIPLTLCLLIAYYPLNAAWDYNVDNKNNFIISILNYFNLII
jgi:hypothetical protein